MIDVQNLVKNYGEFHAVRGVSFSVAKGAVVGFLGPNGAGKTTTIRMLSTFLPPTAGTAKVAGFDIITQADEVRRSIGYLPETPPLYLEMAVEEYLYFVGRIKGVATSSLKTAVNDVVERCSLGDVRRRLCRHLSRGYRQRVGLAQAIIHRPKVIILDEPTSGLDPKQIREIRQMIRSLAPEHTVILSTHILPEVSMVCSRVVIINQGRVVLDGDLAEITASRSLEEIFLERVSLEDKELASSTRGEAANQ